MKKILFFILLLLPFTVNGQQQYKPCLDDGIVRWSVLDYHIIDAGLVSTEIMAYDDILINDIWYKKMYRDEFSHLYVEEDNINWGNYIPNMTWQLENWFIRESEDASKLYIFNERENEEVLISDLNLQEGDEFPILYWEETYMAIVDSVYIKDDLKHVQLVWYQKFNYEPQVFTFIEGVGPDIWFKSPNDDWDIATVNCFQNQSLFYKNEKADQYSICPCGYRYFSDITRPDINKDYNLIIKDDKIEILFLSDSNSQVSVYDTGGSSHYQKGFSQKEIVIPTSSFSKGVYILKIFDEETKQTDVSKIIL